MAGDLPYPYPPRSKVTGSEPISGEEGRSEKVARGVGGSLGREVKTLSDQRQATSVGLTRSGGEVLHSGRTHDSVRMGVPDTELVDADSLFPDSTALTANRTQFTFKNKSRGRRNEGPPLKGRRSSSTLNRVFIPSLELAEVDSSPDNCLPPQVQEPSRYSWVKSPPSSPEGSFPTSPIPGSDDNFDAGDGWEEDFEDWNYDFSAERIRKSRLLSEKGLRGQLRQLYDASQTWFIILLLGIGSGLVAGCIDVVSEWLVDIRQGYCRTAYYNNQRFCCWAYEDFKKCGDWVLWPQTITDAPRPAFLVGYLAFLSFGQMGFATVAALLVHKFAPYASGSGLPEIKTILGGFIIRGFLGKWTLLIKSLGLCLSVASGLCLGKEAALVHVACCCGNVVLRLFPKYRFNEAKKREIFSAAASAGMAVAFGAPIGGVLYSLEVEVSYYFPYKTMWRSFFAAMAAAVTLKWLNPFRTFNLVLFKVTYSANWHGFEMVFFLLLGVMGGILGHTFIRFNLKVTAYRQSSWLNRHPILQAAALGLITAAIAYPNIYMRFDTTDLLSALFKECDNYANVPLCKVDNLLLFELGVAGAFRYVLAILTVGLEIPAGFYMPNMMVGACFGRILGILVQRWQAAYPHQFLFAACSTSSCISPVMYAMVGAAAMLGGVTRLTVSLVVIMFELTGSVDYVLPVMISVMTSKWVGDAFGKGGLTDGLIRLYGYPYLDQREEYALPYTANSVMTRVEDLVTIPAAGVSVECLRNLLNYTTFKGFPVVRSSSERMLVGYVYRSELKAALGKRHSPASSSDQGIQQPGIHGASPCIFDLQDEHALVGIEGSPFLDMRYWTDHQTPLTVQHTLPMELVIDLFCKLGLRYLLVTQNGQLLGNITRKDIIRHLSFVNHPGIPDHLPYTSRPHPPTPLPHPTVPLV
ncbi:hypothetical protein L0F63_002108 [Massospora cicadina]|nr:hypothetical protein L0F63_002108 [Massospora cicadina]